MRLFAVITKKTKDFLFFVEKFGILGRNGFFFKTISDYLIQSQTELRKRFQKRLGLQVVPEISMADKPKISHFFKFDIFLPKWTFFLAKTASKLLISGETDPSKRLQKSSGFLEITEKSLAKRPKIFNFSREDLDAHSFRWVPRALKPIQAIGKNFGTWNFWCRFSLGIFDFFEKKVKELPMILGSKILCPKIFSWYLNI